MSELSRARDWDPTAFGGSSGDGGSGASSSSAAGGSSSSSSASSSAASSSSQPSPSKECLKRIKKDLDSFFESPLDGVIVSMDEASMLKFHVLITGVDDTPYANGFFYFLIALPYDYPASPPRVKLMTTGGGTVRFHPNYYANGKVCLSILNTWYGPSWSPSLSLSSVILSIRSLMVPEPLRQEPGFEKTEDVGAVKSFSDIITHETIRVGIIENLTNKHSMPEDLRVGMIASFTELKSEVIALCASKAASLDGQAFRDPLCGENKGTFQFARLAEKLQELAAQADAGELE